MSYSQQLNSSRLSGSQGVVNGSDCFDKSRGSLTHTWHAFNSCGSPCLESCECDCDDLNLVKTDPLSIKANASLRAVAQFCFNAPNPCEYEIIDIQASPASGLIMHPPDPCHKYDEQNRPSGTRLSPSAQQTYVSSKSGLKPSISFASDIFQPEKESVTMRSSDRLVEVSGGSGSITRVAEVPGGSVTTADRVAGVPSGSITIADRVDGVPGGSIIKADAEQHSRKLNQFFEDKYCQRTFTDFTVYVECTRFDVHKAMLACHSRYFADMFKQINCDLAATNCSIVLDNSFGITASTFRAVLDYMYSGTIPPDACNAGKLLTASKVLQIPDLYNICERLLNVLPSPVNKCNSSDLQNHWKRIARHFGVIWQTEQFLQLSGECIRLLLQREDLSCAKLQLIRALLRWLNFDRCARAAWIPCLVQGFQLSPEEFGTVAAYEEFMIADCEAQEALRKQVICNDVCNNTEQTG